MGTWRRPSWTPMVWLTICGKMVESRDHVLSTRFSPLRFSSSTRVSSRASTYGPFFNDRDMVAAPVDGLAGLAPANDQPVRVLLVVAGLNAVGSLAPGRLRARVADRGLTLAAAVRVIARGHH